MIIDDLELEEFMDIHTKMVRAAFLMLEDESRASQAIYDCNDQFYKLITTITTRG